jgi:hypothetical protein
MRCNKMVEIVARSCVVVANRGSSELTRWYRARAHTIMLFEIKNQSNSISIHWQSACVRIDSSIDRPVYQNKTIQNKQQIQN